MTGNLGVPNPMGQGRSQKSVIAITEIGCFKPMTRGDKPHIKIRFRSLQAADISAMIYVFKESNRHLPYVTDNCYFSAIITSVDNLCFSMLYKTGVFP
jgi:hypothetical protein